MKKTDVVLKECIVKLTDDDLDFIAGKLDQNLQGDLSDCLNLLSRNYDVDRMLVSAKSTEEFYEIVDQIDELVKKEYNKRRRTVKE